MSWKAGDRAYCIDDSEIESSAYEVPNGFIIRGHTYLVEGLRDHPSALGLIIAGKPSLDLHSKGETGWNHSRFRKVIPKCDQIKAKLGIEGDLIVEE